VTKTTPRPRPRSYDELKQVIEAGVEPQEFQRGIAASLHEIERLRRVLRDIVSTSDNTKALHTSDRRWALDLTEQAKKGLNP
jgi:hypothetical protein